MEMPKMRTIPQLVREAKEHDAGTPLNEYFVRRLVKLNKVPHVKVYNKVLIPVEAFYKCLESGALEPKQKPKRTKTGLTKIPE